MTNALYQRGKFGDWRSHKGKYTLHLGGQCWIPKTASTTLRATFKDQARVLINDKFDSSPQNGREEVIWTLMDT